jgi:hypothetical protein
MGIMGSLRRSPFSRCSFACVTRFPFPLSLIQTKAGLHPLSGLPGTWSHQYHQYRFNLILYFAAILFDVEIPFLGYKRPLSLNLLNWEEQTVAAVNG